MALVEMFRHYRDEDKHECNLISNRVNALLYSQAFLVAGAAVLYDRGKQATVAFLGIAIMAVLMNWITSIALCIGCRVLREWHVYGMSLIEKDKTGELKGFFLPGRTGQPDPRHRVSVDYFSWSIPIILGAGWLLAIWQVYTQRAAEDATGAANAAATNAHAAVFLIAVSWPVSMIMAFHLAGDLQTRKRLVKDTSRDKRAAAVP